MQMIIDNVKSILKLTLPFWLILFVLLLHLEVSAQHKLPNKFQGQLDKMQLDIAIPTENSFKVKKAKSQEFWSADYILRSKKSKVEIHYSLITSEVAEQLVPQVFTTTTLANLARNEEEYSDIAFHKIPGAVLSGNFNADWGAIAYFRPKQQISRFQYGKLLSLYKANRGIVQVLFLFNPGGEDTVDNLSNAVRFALLQ